MRTTAALILCFSFLLSCNVKKNESETRVIVLRGPTAIAFAEWLENPPVIAGKKVNITIADSPEQVQAMLIKNEADIAALPMISAANLYNKGIRYRLAGCPIWGNIYLVGLPDAKRLHIFGAGTTPDMLARYHISENNLPYLPDYTLSTPSEITRGLLAGTVEAAVLPEPFVSMVLQKNTRLQLLADLNNPGKDSPGFAETAIVYRETLEKYKDRIDSLLNKSCRFPNDKPREAVRILEENKVFPPGLLTEESIRRCRIQYLTVHESKKEIETFLDMIYRFEPKAIGGRLPEENFYK